MVQRIHSEHRCLDRCGAHKNQKALGDCYGKA